MASGRPPFAPPRPRRRVRCRGRGGAQLTLDEARKPRGRGGWRPGAGRPRGRTRVAHARRVRFAARHPQHVTLRVRADVGSIRRYRVMRVVRAAIRAGGHRADFRVVEFSVQANHLHLLVEAAGAESLTRGMIGLEVRLARRINRAVGRSGAFFADRYHARTLRTPAETRAAIRSVLFNNRHHASSRSGRDAFATRAGNSVALDPCSSAIWFEGWTSSSEPREPWEKELLAGARPHARPTVWLLTTGWKRHGLLRRDERPGPRPRYLA